MHKLLVFPLITLIYFVNLSRAATIETTFDPAKCPDLVEASNQAAENLRAAGKNAADSIEAGGDLRDEACLNDLRSVDFDFFSSISSVKGAIIKQIKDQAIEQITTLTCDAANEAIGAANTYLTCSASVGVTLGVGAGFDDLEAEQCLGAGGEALKYDYDAGRYDNGGSDYGGTWGGAGGVNQAGSKKSEENEASTIDFGTGDASDYF